MRASFDLSPGVNIQARLVDVLEFLALDNQEWIEAQQAAGFDPPCCAHCAEAPWTSGVNYVEHHGAPKGTCREYWGAEKMFTWAQGTCADIVAYDVAALRVKGVNAHPVIIPQGDNLFHAVLWREDRGQVDPTAEWTQGPAAPMPGTSCGCPVSNASVNVGGCSSGSCQR